MAYSFKGNLSFGFVYIPITLYLATQDSTPSFRLFDQKTKSKIQYKKTCEDCGGREVKNDDIVKGYEYENGKFVFLEEKDLEKLKVEKDKNINIEQFIDISEIDPIWYDKSYYVIPKSADKAYYLLERAMANEAKAGLGRAILGNKESLVLVRAKDGIIMLSTLYFAEEIKKLPFEKEKVSLSSNELKMAKMIIREMTGKFEPSKYHDEYSKKVKETIKNKIKGQKIVVPKKKKMVHVEDLMEALKTSLESLDNKNKNSKRKYSQSA